MKLAPHFPIKYGFDGEAAPPVPDSKNTPTGGGTGHFTASFDNRLWMFHRRWEPPRGTPVRATLMIVHGTVDHSGAYAELAQELVPSGIAVFAQDLRGWGLSDGEDMYFNDMDTFVADVDNFYSIIHALPRYDHVTPRFLMGKSLGGNITAYCAAKYPSHWTGLLGLSGGYVPYPSLRPSHFVEMILNGAAMLVPKLPFKTLFDEHLIVSDADALQSWRDDDLCCKSRVRMGYVVELLRSCKELPETVVDKIDLPALMMYGTEDKVVSLSGHQLMIDKIRHSDKELKLYEGGYHNLLLEPTLKGKVMSDIRAWIIDRAK